MTLQRDGVVDPTARRGGAATEDVVVERLRALGTQLVLPVDHEQRAATRARLVAMAAVRTPAAVRRPEVRRSALRRLLAVGGDAPRRRSRMTAGLAGAALTVTALGGLLAASQGAGPGDLLYDVKRGAEQTQFALASDSARGLTLLGFATTRLSELTDLTRTGASALPAPDPASAVGTMVLAAGPDTSLVVGTLATMDDQTTEGTWWLTSQAVRAVDPAALATLAGWAATQRTGLDNLSGSVTTSAAPAVATSADLATAVADRATALQAALSCAGGPATTGADNLGPLPAPCPSPETGTGTGTATVDGDGSPAGGGPSGSPTTVGPAGPPTAGAPTVGDTGVASTSGGAASRAATGSSAGTRPPTSSLDVPGLSGGLPLPLPTLPTVGGSTTSVPPVVQLPLPVAPSSAPVCLGRLICIGS